MFVLKIFKTFYWFYILINKLIFILDTFQNAIAVYEMMSEQKKVNDETNDILTYLNGKHGNLSKVIYYYGPHSVGSVLFLLKGERNGPFDQKKFFLRNSKMKINCDQNEKTKFDFLKKLFFGVFKVLQLFNEQPTAERLAALADALCQKQRPEEIPFFIKSHLRIAKSRDCYNSKFFFFVF